MGLIQIGVQADGGLELGAGLIVFLLEGQGLATRRVSFSVRWGQRHGAVRGGSIVISISLLAESGTDIPGLGKSQGFGSPFGPNNQNNKVLLGTWTPNGPGVVRDPGPVTAPWAWFLF